MHNPGKAAAEMEGLGVTENGGKGACSDAGSTGCGFPPVTAGGGTRTADWEAGVGGPDDEGDGESTTHILATPGLA